MSPRVKMNKTLLPDILHHTPAGASTYTVLHYAQEKHEHDGFHAYDWGKDQTNYQHHGTYEVPQYSLADVTTPVALYWSDNDYFAMPGVTFIRLMTEQKVLHRTFWTLSWDSLISSPG